MSPTDATMREAPGSAVARPDLHLDLRAPEGSITPSLEFGARGYGISNPEAREVSHADLSVAAALRFGRGGWLPTVRYRHDELLLDAAGGRYSAANEAEVEISPSRTFTLYGGGGHRVFFTDDWRTRTEWNLAALGATNLLNRPLVLGGAFRYYRAHRAVHDQVGGTVTAAGELPLGTALRARLAISGAFDDFPRSGGADGSRRSASGTGATPGGAGAPRPRVAWRFPTGTSGGGRSSGTTSSVASCARRKTSPPTAAASCPDPSLEQPGRMGRLPSLSKGLPCRP